MAAINGTLDNDYLTGTPENDGIFGNAGDDNIVGLAGNDSLEGGEGSDTLRGGKGNDNLYAGLKQQIGPGAFAGDTPDHTNYLYGGMGDDQLSGSLGKDFLYGGDGNDTASTSMGEDYVYGGKGKDTIDGGFGDDRLYGGEGDDTIVEGSFRAAGGHDLLDGGNGNDLLGGGTENDILRGGNGNDRLIGAGDANIPPYPGSSGRFEIDTLTGGAGRDTFLLGDARGATSAADFYYDDGMVDSAGTVDYALIIDFTPSKDTLQLAGIAANYILGALPSGLPAGTGIFLDKSGKEPDELVAILQGFSPSDLSLNASYFSYVVS